MPLIPDQSKRVSENLPEYFEDAQYYLASKVQSEYFVHRFSERVQKWYATPDMMKESFHGYKKYENKPEIPLLPRLKTFRNINLEKNVLNRKSTRGFKGKSISFSDLSNLLTLSMGLKEKGKWIKNKKEGESFISRALPSGGGLYALEYYVLSLNVTGLNSGLYHYSPHKASLAHLSSDKKLFDLRNYWSQKELFGSPAAIIYVTAMFPRVRAKYGARALRYILMEAGGVGTQMNLICNAMNVDFCFDGGGCEEKIEGLLGVDGRNEGLVAQFIIGHGAEY